MIIRIELKMFNDDGERMEYAEAQERGLSLEGANIMYNALETLLMNAWTNAKNAKDLMA